MSGESCGNAGTCQNDVSVVAKAVWLVMQSRDSKNFERIVEFLELTREQAPGLICYRHYARLSAGLRGKPPCDVAKVQQSKIHFRKLVLRMIRDEKFRQNYLETTLQAEYGEMFLKALEKLLWEFLYRLQAVLDQEGFKSTEQSRLEGKDLIRTPMLPVSPSNSDKSATTMQQDRSYLFRTDSSSEEPQNGFQTHQTWQRRESDSARKGDDYDSDQTNIECEESQEANVTRIPSDPMRHPRRNGRASDVEEGRTPCFDIFGFDCSDCSKVNDLEPLSSPNPLQSQDAHHKVCLESDKERTRGSVAERNSRGGTKEAKSHALPAHEQQNPCVSGMMIKEQRDAGGNLLQGLTSWRFQPKVHLEPLPLDLVRKYIRPHADSIENDSAPSTAGSELTQNSASTYSGLLDSSATSDDYSNDPDYYPNCNI
ncbi:TERF1-interacting nuclear factor 2 isoform 2-T2 [Mantella aurantiaca]